MLGKLNLHRKDTNNHQFVSSKTNCMQIENESSEYIRIRWQGWVFAPDLFKLYNEKILILN